MKTVFVLLLIFSGIVSKASAHQYFFGFAEVEYKEDLRSIEATVILSAHDFQDVLHQKKLLDGEFEFFQHDSLTIETIGKEVLRSFRITSKKQAVRMECVDFELSKNGLVLIYFQAKNVDLAPEFEVEFSCLMDEFPEQQNKITYINRGEKQTAVFIKQKTSQKLTK